MRGLLIGSTTLRPAAFLVDGNGGARGRLVSRLGAPAVLACLLGLPSVARADFIPPAGVTEYRLIFVTADTIDATSSNIADYNAFATNEATQDTSLPSTTWTAVVSTDAVDAVSNIACTPDCSNIPIYLVDGTEVAVSSTALFNAATVSLLNGIDEDQNGNLSDDIGGYVWTGSFSDGTQATDFTDYDETMGAQNFQSQGSELGAIGATDGTAIDNGGFYNQVGEPIYAISGVIDASSPVPEPTTGSLLAIGGLVMGLIGRSRRRRRIATGG